MENFFAAFAQLDFIDLINAAMRYIFPVLAILIVGRCAISLLTYEKEPEIWAWIVAPDGTRHPVNHWETLIGRSRSCDVFFAAPNASGNACTTP